MHDFRAPSAVELTRLARARRREYAAGSPFPNIHLDHLFDAHWLRAINTEFPDLRRSPDHAFDTPNERKRASAGERRFGPATLAFIHYLNSQPFLEFLAELTGIRGLLPDPYLEGGGCHEILPGGYLKVHADFNKHRLTKLDRRLNVLIYLNEDWPEAYGGHFELWDADMQRCEKRLLPVFNRMALFSTTDYSFHGHPEPLACPPDRSRRSLALYYYTNGRPAHEVRSEDRHPTVFAYRPSGDEGARAYSASFFNKRSMVELLAECVPPIVQRWTRRA